MFDFYPVNSNTTVGANGGTIGTAGTIVRIFHIRKVIPLVIHIAVKRQG